MDLITFSGDQPALADPSMLGQTHYVRHAADHYPTPAWVTEALIPHLRRHVAIDDCVWECACGTGAMAVVLRQHFEQVICTDCKDYGYPDTRLLDFFAHQTAFHGAIVTNPPYGDQAEQFIRHALHLTKPAGVVAMLLRHEYDCARERVDLFNQPPFARQIVLTSRPRWIEGTTGAPRHNFSWFIFDHKWTAEPVKNYHVREKPQPTVTG
jgi:hypothetical protein